MANFLVDSRRERPYAATRSADDPRHSLEHPPMSDPTPAASPATPPTMEKVGFPFGGLWSIAFTIMAFFAVYNAWRDWQFYQIKEPIVVKTPADARALKANQLVEVHIPLDLDAGVAFEFRGGDKFMAAPFEGTEKRLIFATQGELTIER